MLSLSSSYFFFIYLILFHWSQYVCCS